MDSLMPPQQRMHSPESEAAVVSGLLNCNASIDRIPELLPEHFADDNLRMVFAEALSQINRGKPCDVVTVFEGLAGRLELPYIGSLVTHTPSANNMAAYAHIIIERAKSRQLAAASMRINDLAHETNRSVDERIEEAQAELTQLANSSDKHDWVDAHAAMVAHLDVLDARASGKIARIPTGLTGLDQMLDGGFCRGDLVIVGARPSHGKSALAMTIGLHVAASYPTAMISMEMSSTQISDRATAMLGRVPLPAVIRPQGSDDDLWHRATEAVERAKSLQWSVCDTGGLTINQLKAKVRALKRKQGLDLLLVDYIQLMQGSKPLANRAQELEEVSRGLKHLAKELNIVVCCLAQLGRKADELPYDAAPNMSHLKDCGAIEQDADVVLLLKRPIVVKPELGAPWRDYAKLAIGKSRQGATGIVSLHYQGSQTRFSTWAGEIPQRAITQRTNQTKGFYAEAEN